jgi:opacity protein-like surface antigen
MKLTSSIVAIAALSGMSFAGGMIMEPAYENEIVEIPVEPVVEPKKEVVKEIPKPKPVVVEKPAEPSGLYIAGGLTDVAIANNNRASLFKDKKGQDRQIGFTGKLGYDFMDYLGAELRGTYGIAKDSGNKFKQIGAYLKPNYDVTDEINLYGLLGASKTNPGVGSNTGFSYGAGLDYGISDKVSVFTDVVNYMKKSNTSSQWGLTLGAAYQF